jgi:protein TonB
VTKAFSEQLRRERDPATKPIFTTSEIEPMFPEANGGWKVFLQKNLDATVPVTNGVKPGTYKVIVQFIVDENGKLSDIKPLTSLGYGMEEEVVRLMRLSPDWIPAMQNGKKVSAYKKQTVTFVISES